MQLATEFSSIRMKRLNSSDSYFCDTAIPASSIATGRTPITSICYRWVATVALSEC